ncbi:MAG: DNA repair protein RecN [Bacillota bacterium]|nr:DNA repair protein RecN [Bacillota bacterium]
MSGEAMLTRLHIENIALIDRLDIDFSRGLNILSGETGAGKSIIIDSVNIVLGERADKELIKSGEERALVEAVFDISSSPKLLSFFDRSGFGTEDGHVILSRELSASGKGACRINGRMVTVSALKEAGDALVDLHGQHEHQSLLNPQKHLDLIDNFAGAETASLREKVSELYREYKSISNKLASRFGSERDRERMLDILGFQIAEIERAKLTPGEDEELQKEKRLLQNGEKISRALSSGYDAIYGGTESASALESIKAAASSFEGLTGIDERFQSIKNRLDEVYFTLEDAAIEMRDFKNSFEYDAARLEETESRLDEIARLKKKYGSTIQEVLAFLKKAKAEHEDILTSEEQVKQLEAKKQAIAGELYGITLELSEKRRHFAQLFTGKVLEQLSELGLEKSKFEAVFSETPSFEKACEGAFTAKGFDEVEFFITTNVGEPVKPLSKVASGGEMSRIMLAIKNIAADLDDIPSMIFDEIDTGISGRIAQVVAEKLFSISMDRQVVCVTHLPQIASMADSHYLISKYERSGKTHTAVSPLGGAQRLGEVARLAGGADISSVGIEHAGEMVGWAENYKRKMRENR